MKKILKRIFISVLSLVVIVCFALILSYFILKTSLPQYNGTISFQNINDDITVYRDSVAIPYISAKSEKDAAFALGYVHAQDRLFQMDIFRRAAEGRLSEILGSRTLPIDKMFRSIGIYKSVVNNYSEQKAEIKSLLESYSDGVNYYIKNTDGNFPIEFDVLNYKPDLWKPQESLAIGKLLAWELNLSWWTKISYTNLSEKFDASKLAEILPQNYEKISSEISAYSNSDSPSLTDFLLLDKKFRSFLGFNGTHIGSNNWVINKKLSISGSPVIANDPHLAFQAPGKWYAAVIRGGNWNADGFTLPGVPVVVIGKNKNISWVVTNLMADDADFYEDILDSTGTKYLMDNKWHSLNIDKDTIFVKDSASVPIEIFRDHRGPIISGLHPYNSYLHHKSVTEKVISMRWTALEFSDNLFALLKVNKAGNWNEFKAALKYFDSPGQNFVYADKQNNIGYIAAAKLPIRNNQKQRFIYDGTLSSNDWRGFVPYGKMPTLFNPKKNYIATANNKVVKSFKYHISNLWEPSSRIDRINELLNSKSRFSIDDFKNYQMDFKSKYAENLVPYIIHSFQGMKIKDANLAIALNLFRQWNYLISSDSQTPSIYLMFFQKLMENIFKDEMGDELFEEYVFLANVPYRVVSGMLKTNNSSWFDNIYTPNIERRDEIIRKSLIDALGELESNYGKNPANWQWGKLHKITFKHLFHGFNPIIDKIVDVGPYEIGGDGTTIFNTEYSFRKPFDVNLGPSMRYLYDFATPNKILFVLPLGQSGNIFSPHYNDMTKNWLSGKYFEINTNENEWEKSGMEALKIKKVNL